MQGQSGRVVYSLVINKDGSPDLQSIKVIRSDDLRFEWAAREWLKQARFSVACFNGQAVRVLIVIPIDFKAVGR
jgi:TonB family protein